MMENYTKGSVKESEDDISSFPAFPDLPENLIHVRVKGGSKPRNLLDFAFRAYKDEDKRHIVFSGSGPAVVKTITCAEIVKRRYKTLHQITKIAYKKIEEIWEPKNPELDQLKVVREIPAIYILLCKDPLDKNIPGYQAPGMINVLEQADRTATKRRKSSGKEFMSHRHPQRRTKKPSFKETGGKEVKEGN